MNDLPAMMDCQFCDGPAVMGSGRPAVFKYQISCAKCGMHGVPMLEHPDGRGPERAILSWNRLHALIAKGRLAEATDSGPGHPQRL